MTRKKKPPVCFRCGRDEAQARADGRKGLVTRAYGRLFVECFETDSCYFAHGFEKEAREREARDGRKQT